MRLTVRLRVGGSVRVGVRLRVGVKVRLRVGRLREAPVGVLLERKEGEALPRLVRVRAHKG